METINNATSLASRMIWGENNKTSVVQNSENGNEPLSGQTGSGKGGEPYDAGNSTNGQDVSKTSNNIGSTDNPTAAPNGEQSASLPGNTQSTGPIRPEHEHDKTGVIDAHQPSSGFSSDKPTSSNESSGPGPQPSVGAAPVNDSQNTELQQGSDRPGDVPTGHEEKAVKDSKETAEDAQNIDASGPGPQPVSERNKGPGASTGSGDDDDDGPQKVSHGEGTGEKWIKTSGMKADGGSFDASQAGAGKEADRLLEEKGVHRETPGEGAPAGKEEVGVDNKSSKPSLGEKIKAKLHKS